MGGCFICFEEIADFFRGLINLVFALCGIEIDNCFCQAIIWIPVPNQTNKIDDFPKNIFFILIKFNEHFLNICIPFYFSFSLEYTTVCKQNKIEILKTNSKLNNNSLGFICLRFENFICIFSRQSLHTLMTS